jgi:SAM-dependent methyltransferase
MVRCRGCGLLYVGARRRDFTFAATNPALSRALGAEVDRLGIVDRALAASGHDSTSRAYERLARVCRHRTGGRLLDVGACDGAFVAVAGQAFRATGIEPDPGTSARARQRGLDVRTEALGSLAAVPQWDVVTMFHVLEHLDSPRVALRQVRRLLAPGGLLVIETPTVENPWFALAPGRWRQLIPDHYWFFSPATLSRLLSACGLRALEWGTVGSEVSLRFAADRLRRAGIPGAGVLSRRLADTSLADRRLVLNPRDIMQVIAVPTEPQQSANLSPESAALWLSMDDRR